MNILSVTHSFIPYTYGGTEVYAHALCRELAGRHTVSVFFRRADFAAEEFSLLKIGYERFSAFALNNTFRRCCSFRHTYSHEAIDESFAQVLERVRPDVVHMHHTLYLSVGMIKECRNRGIPVVYTLHDYWLLCPQGQLFRHNAESCHKQDADDCEKCVLYQLGIRKNVSSVYAFVRAHFPERLFHVVKDAYVMFARSLFLSPEKIQRLLQDRADCMKRACAQVDLFIAPSKFMRDRFILSGIPEHRIKYLPNGVEFLEGHGRQKSAASVVRFGFIGNFMPSKGLHVLIQGFQGIDPQKAELRIYGAAYSYKSALGGYVRRVTAMIRDRNIRLMGAFDHARIAEVFRDIDVLVVPSLWFENSPLVIQEAFLARTPVIASRIGGIPELVTDQVNGFLFEPGNADELRQKFELLIAHPEILPRMKNNLPKVKDIAENARELEALYQRLLKHANQPERSERVSTGA